MLSWIVFSPLLVIVPMLLVPSERKELIRWLAVLGTVPSLLLAIYIFATFDRSVAGVNDPAGFQYVIQNSWIPAFHIEYYMGIDGLSVTMVLLTALLCFLCIFASWGIEKGIKGYMSMFMILEVGMMGVFVSLDFFLFYVFWEVMLLPMYFLIGVWGGPRKIYAAIKFFLYTLFGSVLMLIAMLALYYQSGHSFNLVQMMAGGEELENLAHELERAAAGGTAAEDLRRAAALLEAETGTREDREPPPGPAPRPGG